MLKIDVNKKAFNLVFKITKYCSIVFPMNVISVDMIKVKHYKLIFKTVLIKLITVIVQSFAM